MVLNSKRTDCFGSFVNAVNRNFEAHKKVCRKSLEEKDIVYRSGFRPTVILLSLFLNFHVHHCRLTDLGAYHTNGDALIFNPVPFKDKRK